MSFTNKQNEELQGKLDPKNISSRAGPGGKRLSYLEGWFVIQEANRIFGHDAWSRETLEIEHLHAPYERSEKWIVSYRARVRVTVNDVVREGTGFGNGAAGNETDAHELAIKEAETDAMKRAFMTFGNPFGLALYDKTQENVATVADAYIAVTDRLMRSSRFTDRKSIVEWWNENKNERVKAGLTKEQSDQLITIMNELFPAEQKDAA